MFKVGDLIHYANTGVCRVADITTRQGGGADQLYYILDPLYQSCVISVPADTKKVFMRPIITKQEAGQLIDTIPSVSAEPIHSAVQREVTNRYEASLQTHDCAELIGLAMSIFAKKRYVEGQNRKFSAVEERYMKRAEDLLFGELAAALEIPREDVPDYILRRVGTCENHESWPSAVTA